MPWLTVEIAVSIESTYLCDGCNKWVSVVEAKRSGWFSVSLLWEMTLDWQKTDGFHYCSLACLVKDQSHGKQQLGEASSG